MLDRRALREAEDSLGLRRGVHVQLVRLSPVTSGASVYVGGQYDGERGGRHVITINPNSTPHAASAFLWHELTHAMQAEACGGERPFRRAYTAQLREHGLWPDPPADFYRRYASIPYEREAFAMQERAMHGELSRLLWHSAELILSGPSARVEV